MRLAGWGCVGILSVLLLFCPGPVHAQPGPSKVPWTQDDARRVQQQLQAMEDEPPWMQIVHFFESWVVFFVVAMVVVGVVVVLKMGGSLWVRTSATTDLEKLAQNDPWIRDHLSRQKAGADSPTKAPSWDELTRPPNTNP